MVVLAEGADSQAEKEHGDSPPPGFVDDMT
jgi:hypothetical protein